MGADIRIRQIRQKPYWQCVKRGDKVRLVASSDPRSAKQWEKILELEAWLCDLGLRLERGRALTQRKEASNGCSPEVRAADLMEALLDPDAALVFDVSGGTIANALVEFLDYQALQSYMVPFFGFSNISVLLNVLQDRTGHCVGLYDLMRVVYDTSGKQKDQFLEAFFEEKGDLFSFHVQKIQGDVAAVTAVLTGGNFRSLLQVAGTPFWPDLKGKILFLESLGGDEKRVESQFWQLRQMGVFQQVKGVVLGQFTTVPDNHRLVTKLIEAADRADLPIWLTEDIGHHVDSKGLLLGAEITLA